MADKFGVSIEVPSHEAQENNISVFGPAQNCESAKLALEVRVQELEAEREERVSVYIHVISYCVSCKILLHWSALLLCLLVMSMC